MGHFRDLRDIFIVPNLKFFQQQDDVAEWLRRQPAKLMEFLRVGSNPIVVELFCRKKILQPAGIEPTELLSPRSNLSGSRLLSSVVGPSNNISISVGYETTYSS